MPCGLRTGGGAKTSFPAREKKALGASYPLWRFPVPMFGASVVAILHALAEGNDWSEIYHAEDIADT
jgi:hypothetical protein